MLFANIRPSSQPAGNKVVVLCRYSVDSSRRFSIVAEEPAEPLAAPHHVSSATPRCHTCRWDHACDVASFAGRQRRSVICMGLRIVGHAARAKSWLETAVLPYDPWVLM
jgi:hypothetical protein